MSKPAAKQPNIIVTILYFVTLYLMFNMMCNQQKAVGVDYHGQRVTTTAQIHDALVDANRKIFDVSAAELDSAYEKALDADVKDKKITEDQAQVSKMEAAILLADTQYKAGIDRKEMWRMRNAHQTLFRHEKGLVDKPIWKQTFQVADVTNDKRFGWKEWTPEQLNAKVIDTIGERSKTELIWGFIPGGYQLVDFLVHLTGAQPSFSYAFAALILAIFVRILVWPLSQKQFMFGRYMSQLAPLSNEIKAQYKDDPQMQQRKVMELYSEYGINPVAGCLPGLVQIPLFWTVYQCMQLYQFSFVNGQFLWVNPETSRATHGFLAPNLGVLDPILIIVYGILMVVSSLLMPVSDPSQLKQQRIMSIGFGVMVTVSMFLGLFPVPGAFVLYWIFLQILSSLQALRAYRMPVPPLQKVNTAAGGVYPGANTFGGKWAKKMQDMMLAAEAQKATGQAPPASGKPASNGQVIKVDPGNVRTGAPAKHKPKKRK